MIFVFVVVIVGFGGCMIYDLYIGEEKIFSVIKGSIIGVFGGVVIGVVIFSKSDWGKGVLIGVVGGVVIGGGIGYYMDKQEVQLCCKLEGFGVWVVCNGDQIELIMFGNIIFDLNQLFIKFFFIDILELVSFVFKEFDKIIIQIEGYIDSFGFQSYNQLLSEQCVGFVWDFLFNQNIVFKCICVVGYGECYLIVFNDSVVGCEQNCWVELILVLMQ